MIGPIHTPNKAQEEAQEMSDKTQFIVIHESTSQAWLRDASSFALFSALIGAGVLVGSAAMQWAGFVVAVIVCIGRASKLAPKRMTRDEAIEYLRAGE